MPGKSTATRAEQQRRRTAHSRPRRIRASPMLLYGMGESGLARPASVPPPLRAIRRSTLFLGGRFVSGRCCMCCNGDLASKTWSDSIGLGAVHHAV
eukprot:1470027-Rhodomonas_salina.1